VIIVSIPHTGTRFLRRRMRTKRYIHVTEPWDKLVETLTGREVISPLRSPQSVWRSYSRRWVDPDSPIDTIGFINNWYTMHTLTLFFDIDFIPVDLQQDKRITDWSPIGERDAGDAVHPDIDLSKVYQLPFVQKWYG